MYQKSHLEANPDGNYGKIKLTAIFYMKYYSIRQAFMIPSFTINDVKVEELHKFLKLLEKSGVCVVIEKAIKRNWGIGGRPTFDPYNMLATILYSFAFSSGSLRDIEELITYDLRGIYLMENERPTYKTIGNFINKIILPNCDEIFSLITKEIFEECNLTMDTVFIDVSKFEADANKYNFVWKPTSFHLKLSNKIISLLEEYDLAKDLKRDEILPSSKISEKLILLDKILAKYDFSLKKSKRHKDAYNQLLNYFEKSLEYEEKERICGPNRKSYYKTDHDATAMCLKEDYYSGLGSNMHAAYNVQLSVSNGLITCFLVSQTRTDSPDFIPTIEKIYKYYKNYPKYVCADAGYGSFENYDFLAKHKIENYVKYFTWEGNISASRPSQYMINDDESITCLNGNTGFKFNCTSTHTRKKDTVFYKIEGCNNCEFNIYCKRFMKEKTENFKLFEVNVKLQKYIKQSEDNLLSPKGIELRVNRSCQVEGAFGILKQDFHYERFRRTSLEKVNLEFMLTCMGVNIRKFFHFLEGKPVFKYWEPSANLEPEKRKKPSAKRLNKKASRIKTKSVNQEAKSKYKY